MGDSRGYETKLTCCACNTTFYAHTRDRLLKFQLCEPCRIRGYALDRDDPYAMNPKYVLRRDGRLIRELGEDD